MMFTRAQVRKQKSNGSSSSGGNNQRQRPTRSQQQKQQEQQQYAYDVSTKIKMRNNLFLSHLSLPFITQFLIIFRIAIKLPTIRGVAVIPLDWVQVSAAAVMPTMQQ